MPDDFLADSARAALSAEVRRLSGALRDAQRALAALGGTSLPGLHLVLEAGGRRALLPVAQVAEVVRMVALAPLPGAPAHVLGTFSWRGVPVVAVDLAAAAGARADLDLDARVVVLAGAPALGLAVERVAGTVDGPGLFEGDPAEAAAEGWRGSPLVAGLCVDAGEVLPLLDPSPLRAALAGAGAPAGS
ncbi:chemotaxis protein CheW [Anaeromyxobacter sp. Red801]|uniref:chemotaxis protein CheW n=1 Tax=Anaeromyxobacter sp. Red801 TaxID=3411632 RepID=UPI003BA387CD